MHPLPVTDHQRHHGEVAAGDIQDDRQHSIKGNKIVKNTVVDIMAVTSLLAH
jgi:hypothetical protein